METKPLFFTSIFQQKRALDLLITESKTSNSFYLFLVAASFLTTLGLMLNSPVIIIGGMLVAPLLFPILLVGMGVATASASVIKRASIAIIKSILVVGAVSFITAFLLFDGDEATPQMVMVSTPNLLYALAAFASGIIGAYAWARENIATHIPAIAITVSLIPPLCSAGIALSLFSREVFSGGITLFIINIVGIVAAAVIVFSLFGYSRIQRAAESKVQREEKKEEKEKEEKEQAKEE